ncbi:MAG: DUF6197 family protein [Rhodospirillaceae bacterium]
MTDEGYPNAPIELEVYSGGQGVLRTAYGWLPVTRFKAAPRLSLEVDASHQVAPTSLDRSIVKRAAEILSTAEAWNRADNRKCPVDATTWSIYCAMERAAQEVTGGVHHRRPASEIVRQIIEERSAGRDYHHRLMEYNNDPATALSDVQGLFREALARIESPTWLDAHGFDRHLGF